MSAFNTDPPPFIFQNYQTGGGGPQVVAINGTLGTSSVQVIGPQANRQSITFFNPNSVASVAFCPVTDANGNALAAAINGAGSYTLLPLGEKTIYGPCGAAWNACASQASQSLTIWTTF